MNQISICLDLLILVICLILGAGCRGENRLDSERYAVFLPLLETELWLLLADLSRNLLSSFRGAEGACIWLSDGLIFLEAICCFRILRLFTRYLAGLIGKYVPVPESLYRISDGICYLGLADWCIRFLWQALFSGSGRALLMDSVYRIPAWVITLSIALGMVLFYRRKIRRALSRALFIIAAFPIAGWLAQLCFPGLSAMPTAFAFSLLLIHNYVHAQLVGMLFENRAELRRHETRSMIRTLSPDFLICSVHTIAALCPEDPETAQMAVEDFADFLRSDLDNLSRPGMVSLGREVQTVSTYMRLQMLNEARTPILTDYITHPEAKVPQMSLQILTAGLAEIGMASTGGRGRILIFDEEGEEGLTVTIRWQGPSWKQSRSASEMSYRIGYVSARLSEIGGEVETDFSAPYPLIRMKGLKGEGRR